MRLPERRNRKMANSYTIEVKTKQGWMEMPGEPGYNEWETIAEAEEIIATLDPDATYRVVES
jgi:hypothetical protein